MKFKLEIHSKTGNVVSQIINSDTEIDKLTENLTIDHRIQIKDTGYSIHKTSVEGAVCEFLEIVITDQTIQSFIDELILKTKNEISTQINMILTSIGTSVGTWLVSKFKRQKDVRVLYKNIDITDDEEKIKKILQENEQLKNLIIKLLKEKYAKSK